MTVKVLFFAKLREKMGVSEINLVINQSVTLDEFQALIAAEYPVFEDLPQPIVIAINQEFAQSRQLVSNGDEVAFFPPVTGG